MTAPTVESNRYNVPILLRDTDADVSSLDFQLRYDPAVFTPESVSAGASTIAAGKVVEGNGSEPGAYKVLVMGLNQNSLPEGEVARVVLRRIDEQAGDSVLEVASPTLANSAGDVLESTGSIWVVPGKGEAPAEETPPEESPTPQQHEGEPAAPQENPVEPSAPLGDVNPDVARKVADAVLKGLEEHRNLPQARPGVPKDSSPRVSGEDNPQPEYSIRERRLPSQMEFQAGESAQAAPVERMQVAQAEKPAAAGNSEGNKITAPAVDAENPAAQPGVVNSAGTPATTIEEKLDVVNPVVVETGVDQGVPWGWSLVALPVLVLSGYMWRRRRTPRS